MSSQARQRWPRWVYNTGGEPDPRFSLANERTFLAWLRTSLALLAAGVALTAVPVPYTPAIVLVVSSIFLTLGGLAALQGWVGWASTERALRQHRPLRGPTAGLYICVGVAGCTLVLLAVTLL